VAAVAGIAGAGKTVLARDFAVQHQDDYQAVWWIDAERRDASRGNMLADVAALGAELSERIRTEAQSNIERAARETLRLIEAGGYARPLLLVYDNVDRPADMGAHILLTTRYAEWDDMVAKVDVGVLDREAAVEFLLRRGKKKAEEREAASRLADALDCLPLALDHPLRTARSGGGRHSTSTSACSPQDLTSQRAARVPMAAASARRSR
jgi:hypothetical protein